MTFHEFIREKRLQKGMTLRTFCKTYGYDTAYISRLENDRLPPSISDEKLKDLASALDIKNGSSDWITFFDLAAIARKELPKEIAENAPEILTLLPAFLRTPDNKRLSREKIKELVDFLKEDKISG